MKNLIAQHNKLNAIFELLVDADNRLEFYKSQTESIAYLNYQSVRDNYNHDIEIETKVVERVNQRYFKQLKQIDNLLKTK